MPNAPIPTFEELSKAIPTGIWLGDERMRSELDSLHLMCRAVRTVSWSDSFENPFIQFAKRLGLTTYDDLSKVSVIEELNKLSPAECVAILAHSRFNQIRFDQQLPLSAPRCRGDEDEEPVTIGNLIYRGVGTLAHIFVMSALRRMFPQWPLLAHLLEWSIIDAVGVYIFAYRVQRGDVFVTVDGLGNDIDSFDSNSVVLSDPRVQADRSEVMAINDMSPEDRIIARPDLFYHV